MEHSRHQSGGGGVAGWSLWKLWFGGATKEAKNSDSALSEETDLTLHVVECHRRALITRFGGVLWQKNYVIQAIRNFQARLH